MEQQTPTELLHQCFDANNLNHLSMCFDSMVVDCLSFVLSMSFSIVQDERIPVLQLLYFGNLCQLQRD